MFYFSTFAASIQKRIKERSQKKLVRFDFFTLEHSTNLDEISPFHGARYGIRVTRSTDPLAFNGIYRT